MNLAFLTSLVPDDNPTTGYEIANKAIVDGLRDLGHSVHVIGFRLDRHLKIEHPQTHVLDTLNVENAGASAMQKIGWIGKALMTHLPISCAKLRAYPWSGVKQVLDANGPYDGLVLNSVQMAAAYPQLVSYAPYAYVAHNIEHVSALSNAERSSGLTRYLYQRDARLLDPLENRLAKDAAYVWTLSDDDTAYFKLGERCATMPMVTPFKQENASRQNSLTEQPYDLGMIGTWTWGPNLAGLNWFLDEVVPLLPQDFSIAIAGSVTDTTSSDHKGVQLLGRVDDALAFVDDCKIVPLVSRTGTGVQLKTIETFQTGKPCVATSSSVRGISYMPENCRVEDDAATFASAAVELVEGVRNGSLQSQDGRAFFDGQRRKLMEQLASGLSFFERQEV